MWDRLKQEWLPASELGLAVTLWAVGLGGAAAGQKDIQQYLYFFAWYPYLLFLDGLLGYLTGRSWLFSRPRKVLPVFFWSVTIWLVFEAANLVLKNWAYEGLTATWWLRWGGYTLAFATVLPGILLTAQVLRALGAFKGLRGRALQVGPAWQPAALLTGVALLVLPLASPRYAFALVWLAFIPLLDPCALLLGGASLLDRFLAGERQESLCLLGAGLICGLWWEAWNSMSTAKWVYTLPVLNFWKIFEMPLLGYLGFLPFALEAAVMYNFMEALTNRVLTTRRRRRAACLWQLAFWLLMFAALDAWTVKSYQ
jgi:hypothetical protein